MYESTQIKRMPATEYTFVVQLIKISNVHDGFGNVHAGIFTQHTRSMHANDHADLVLIASKK